jgi:hypothetical protein
MSLLKEPTNHLPVGGRRYTDPKTGVTIVGDTVGRLIQLVTRERGKAGLDSSNVREEVEEFTCSQYPHLCERRVDGSPVERKFTRKDVLAFVESVRGTIESGGVVQQEEAERRANICQQCPYNRRVAGCEGCNGISGLIFKVIGARRVKAQGSLKNCSICGCSLKPKVWVPKEVLEKTSEIQENSGDFPSWCWVRQ